MQSRINERRPGHSLDSAPQSNFFSAPFWQLSPRQSHRLLIMFASEQSEVFPPTSIQAFSGF